MRLGIVSDSHGHVELTLPAIRMLEALQIERVLHCGDIDSAAVVELFAKWPTDFVFGNCDGNRAELTAAIAATGQSCHGEFGALEIAGCRVALVHSHDAAKFREAVHGGSYDLVCYGHTHVATIDRHGSTLAVNPGALFRANPHSVAIVDLPALQATIVPL